MNIKTLTMPHSCFHPVISLAGLVTTATLLVGCSVLLDLGVTNSCGQDVVVGIENSFEPSFDNWYPVADGTELVESVRGFDKVLIAVIPDGADQVFDHTEVDPDSLETTETHGVKLVKLDLSDAGLCP